MGFVDDISDYRSLAIVGLEKNTGKTECLNYILRRIKDSADRFALTSIGIDGENRDQVCQTPKPEIIVPEGMIFVTSEKHYRERRLVAEIMEIDDHRTALGRLVIARACGYCRVEKSDPAYERFRGTNDLGRRGFVPFKPGVSHRYGGDGLSDGGCCFREYSGIGETYPLCL